MEKNKKGEEKKQDTTFVEAQNERWDGIRNEGIQQGMTELERGCNKQKEGDKGQGERKLSQTLLLGTLNNSHLR